MFSVFNFSTLTMGIIYDVFRIDFVVEKNNLVVGVYGVFGLVSYPNYNMGLVARKPVFGGFWTTQTQTSLRIRAVWSAPLLFAFRKVPYVDLLQMNFQFSS